MLACPAAAAVTPGAACSAEGLTCPAPDVSVNCGGAVPTCSCENGVWARCVYDGPTSGGKGCPRPVCPEPYAVVDGEACDLPSTMMCKSYGGASGCDDNPLFVPCSCQDQAWACGPSPSPPSCPEAGQPDGDGPDAGPDVIVVGCPPPEQVFQGGACSNGDGGLECPGNPQVCDGAVFYDALQCNGSVWITVAATQCGDAGGEIDADVDADDGGVFEAGIGD